MIDIHNREYRMSLPLIERLKLPPRPELDINSPKYDPSTLFDWQTTDKKYKLMIKTHWETGVSYLCITKSENFRKYSGSGSRWRKLLEKYPGPTFTYLLFSTDSKEELAEQAKLHSEFWDVANSEIFANNVPELGYEGNQGNLPMWWELASDDRKAEARAKQAKSFKETCLEKYGETCTFHLARLRLSEICEEQGVSNVMQLPGVAEKNRASAKKTLMEKYGVEHNMQIPGLAEQVRASREETMMERYGVIHSLQIPGLADQVRNKREETMMKKYGVKNISELPEVAKQRGVKISETLQQRELKKCNYCDHLSKNIKNHENYCESNPQRKVRKEYECEHCGIKTNATNIKRWHGDNCKLKDKNVKK